jgi:hypothetical protein
MANTQHERLVCKAIIHLIEQRNGDRLTLMYAPEDEERQRPAVELICPGTASTFAFEHTLVESFPQQLEDDARFLGLLGPLEARLRGTLPLPGHYVLTVAIGATTLGKAVREAQRIQNALETWGRMKAPTLRVGSPATAPHHYLDEAPPGVPFEVSLHRWPGIDGQFFIGRVSPSALEEKRQLRLRRALDEKCPKLQAAGGPGRRAVLVLESQDIALASYGAIAEALRAELARFSGFVPDEIYLVQTATDPWGVRVLKEGTHVVTHVLDPGPHYVDLQRLYSSD